MMRGRSRLFFKVGDQRSMLFCHKRKRVRIHNEPLVPGSIDHDDRMMPIVFQGQWSMSYI